MDSHGSPSPLSIRESARERLIIGRAGKRECTEAVRVVLQVQKRAVARADCDELERFALRGESSNHIYTPCVELVA